MYKICQCCHIQVEDGTYCNDCEKMTDLTRRVATVIINDYNPVFRRQLSAVLLKDRDIFIAALLRGE